MQANERVGHTGVELTKGRDPSNTHALQKALLRELQRRLRDVRGAIRRTVGYQNDALGLRQNADATAAYDYPTEQGRRRAFMRELRQWLRDALLGDTTAQAQIRNGDHWIAEYIREAYQVGYTAGEERLLRAGLSLDPSDTATVLRRPVTQRQLAGLYARAFENLKGVTEAAAQQLRETLTAGTAAGKNPRALARDLNAELADIERTRLATIARTEVINSHADAALDSYEQNGATVVGHTARMTAKDASVCAFCRALDGVPFTLAEFRTVTVMWGSQPYQIGVPAHPNGRCTPAPEIGLDDGDLAPLRERLPNTAGGKPITLLSS